MEGGTMKMVTSALLMMVLFAPATLYSYPCPPPEDVRPCICVRSTVVCQKRNMTLQELDKPLAALVNMSRRTLLTLRLRYANLSTVPLEIFEKFRPYDVQILDCSLKNVTNHNNLTLSALKMLKIWHSVNDTTGGFSLSLPFFSRLTMLDLSFNVFKILRRSLFAGGPLSLTHLTVQSSSIETLEEEVFADLRDLISLDLSGNKIRMISSSMMPNPAHSLQRLDLNRNNLTTIDEDFFIDMVTLYAVRIEDNKISELPEKTWESVWLQLTSLFMYKNPLRCDSHIEWTFKLRMPQYTSAYCESPPERKGMSLQQLINRNRGNAEPKPTEYTNISS